MGRIALTFAALGAGLLMAGCSQAAEPADTAEAPNVEAAANLIGPGATTPTRPASDHCLIQVEGRTWLDKPCPWDASDQQIVVNTPPADGEDFVYLDRLSPTTAMGNWSGGGGGGHAHDRLGELTRDGNCWANARARICLPSAAAADFDRVSP